MNKIIFCFSSKNHKEKFLEQYLQNRHNINTSLSKRFKFTITVNTLADIALYKQIETRGFLIKNIEGEKLCKESILLNGGKVMKKDSTKK
jgi:hypothetical protein